MTSMAVPTSTPSATPRQALTASTLAFTVCFAVWTIFSIIGIKIKAELGLTDTQFGILLATPILTGSLSRLLLGIWSDQYGGRLVLTVQMLTTAVATFLLAQATSYAMLILAALGVGLAGGSFAIGVAYVSRWYPKHKQGTALGIFGMGNVGAAITNFAAPILLVALNDRWQSVAQLYAFALVVTAISFYLFTKDDPDHARRKAEGLGKRSFLEQLQPLKSIQVWRFSLYYFFVFGAFVALALWLPRYYIGAYGLDLATAGLLVACYSLPGSIFRALGGWLADFIGARRVMYWTLIASLICLTIMSYPPAAHVVEGGAGPVEFSVTIPLGFFVFLTVVLGFFMSLGKAAVYKHIPAYYPKHVGAVGGVVGLIGGLGGFVLPIVFGLMYDLIGVWSSCFMLLAVLVAVTLAWMHLAITKMERRNLPDEPPAPRTLTELEPQTLRK